MEKRQQKKKRTQAMFGTLKEQYDYNRHRHHLCWKCRQGHANCPGRLHCQQYEIKPYGTHCMETRANLFCGELPDDLTPEKQEQELAQRGAGARPVRTGS